MLRRLVSFNINLRAIRDPVSVVKAMRASNVWSLFPSWAKPIARFTAEADFATPPFWLARLMIVDIFFACNYLYVFL